MKNRLTLRIRKASGIAVLLLTTTMLLAVACGTRAQPAVPYDLQFIDAMVAHHQAAIDMSLPADTNALRPELRDFARKVVDDQSREIQLMKGWRQQWYPGKPQVPTIMAMPGMKTSMEGMGSGQMKALKGADYDRMYVDMMIPHHEGAVALAREAKVKSQRPEIRDLSQRIIDIQQGEIEMMSRWKSDWAKAR
jgi:uncharacterized protein (DUF305 family)